MQYRKAKETNATDTSFASRAATLTKPSGDGVHHFGDAGPANLLVAPYGTGDADDQFAMKVILWRSHGLGSARLWIPTFSDTYQFVCTLGTGTGATNGAISASEKFCDTVTNLDPYRGGIVSPADNTSAYFLVNGLGCEAVEFIFDALGGAPSGMNALWIMD